MTATRITRNFAPATAERGIQWACNSKAQALHANGDLYTFVAANKRHARRALRLWVAKQCAAGTFSFATAQNWLK